MREVLTSSRLPRAVFRYSQMVKIGGLYQSAGVIGIDPDTNKLVEGGIYAESKTILTNMFASLPDFELSLNDLLSVTVYVVPFSDFPAFNRAWEEFFTPDLVPPARTSVGVAALPLNAAVEMEFKFFRPQGAS